MENFCSDCTFFRHAHNEWWSYCTVVGLPLIPRHTARNDGKGGRRVGNLPEDSTTSVEGYPPHSPDTKEYTTLLPVTPANTGAPAVTEVTTVGDSNVHVDLSLSGNQAICYLVCFHFVENNTYFRVTGVIFCAGCD